MSDKEERNTKIVTDKGGGKNCEFDQRINGALVQHMHTWFRVRFMVSITACGCAA